MGHSSSVSIPELIRLRNDAYRMKFRETLACQVKVIQDELKPLYPDRPYGLPEWLEGTREHIWELVFQYVSEVETISNLREVSDLFRNLLERKYVAGRLPEILAIGHQSEGRVWHSTWFCRLVHLRILSKGTKATADSILERGSFGQAMFTARDPFKIYLNNFREYVHPAFSVTASVWGGAEPLFRKIICKPLMGDEDVEVYEDRSSLKTFRLQEYLYNGNQIDLRALLNSVEDIVDRVGHKCKYFVYEAYGSKEDVYMRLRRCVAPMYNLKELIFDKRSPWEVPPPDDCPPFPICTGLKRYVETSAGLKTSHLCEIFKANPTIEEVALTDALLNVVGVTNALEHLGNLRSLFCGRIPSIQFFQHCNRFHWLLNLTSFTLWDNIIWYDEDGPRAVPSSTLFKFISNLKNLKHLRVSSIRTQNTGGYVELPNLMEVTWKIRKDFRSLEFLTPCEGLVRLDLDVSDFNDVLPESKILGFLRMLNIPDLFPALKSAHVCFEKYGVYRRVWKKRFSYPLGLGL